MTYKHAAHYAGVTPSTLYRWIKLGKERLRGAHHDFVRSLLQAEAKGVAANLAMIKRAAQGIPAQPDREEPCDSCSSTGQNALGKTCRACGGAGTQKVRGLKGVPPDAKAAQWMLERRHREAYGKSVTELQITDGNTMHRSPEEIEALRAELLERLEREAPQLLSAPQEDSDDE